MGTGGCGLEAPQTRTARTAARLPLRVYDTTTDGLRLVTLPRATPGVVRVALYVDAGSRDAHEPQAATIAAWIAAETADVSDALAIETTVFPDVTELALACTSDGVATCVERLARALATRDATPAAMSRARTRLREGQRRALARDPHEQADHLALHALLGPTATSFFPLGRPDADLTAATDLVPGFLRDHYGPRRALLVAAGDVEPIDVREAATRWFSRVPAAARPRAAREAEPLVASTDEPKLEVAIDDRAAVSFALAGPNESALRDVVSHLAAALARAEPRVDATGHVFGVRGGALALLHLTATDVELSLDRAARELARLQLEPSAPVAPQVHDDSLIASCRELGLELGVSLTVRRDATLGATAALPERPAGTPTPIERAPHEPGASRAFQFGAGVALAAGSDAGPAAREQTLELAARRTERAQATWQRALSQAEPTTHGDIDELIGAVTLDNGAHVDVQFTHGEAIAVAIRVGVGADRDSPLLHGQAALLATLTSTACAGMGPELLHSRFARMGATLEPRVDGESYGVLLRVPREHFEQALDLALRCARAPSRDPRDLVETGVRLQQRLRKSPSGLALRARAANVASPRAPGGLAPWGDPERVPNFSPRDLETALRATQTGDRWAVGVVGPVQVKRTVTLIARRLADLQAGAPKPIAWSEPAAVLPAELPPSREAGGSVKLLAVWTTRGAFDQALGARLFTRALAALLGAVPGVEVLWQEADVYKQTALAALALRLRPDLVTALPSLLAGAAKSIDDAWLGRALEPAVLQAQQVDNADQAQLATRAERITRQRLGAAVAAPHADRAAELVRALRDSRPGFAPLP
ncbi:MAG: hypothetical protein ABW321_04750 [Polyangiales bacterium]